MLNEGLWVVFRGCGMFVGCELVKNRDTREPATAEAQHVIYKLKQNHILFSADGPHRNVLKFKPPLTFNKRNVDTLVAQLDTILSDIERVQAGVNGCDVSEKKIDELNGGSQETKTTN